MPFVLLQAAQVDVPLHTVIAIISAVFSGMLSVIVWLLKHSFDAEKRLMIAMIEDAKAIAKNANDKLGEQTELRHKQELTLNNIEGTLQFMRSDIDELRDEDASKDSTIAKLKERLDRGQRTISQQMQPISRQDPDSDPPAPRVRPRIPSRTNE